MGDSLYMDWFPYWLSDFALEHEVVIISANYRLMPQVTGVDIYNYVEDFWTWLFEPDTVSDIFAAHTTPTEIDFAHVLVTGESAGGLLSINSALSHAATGRGRGRDGITAAIAMYPTVDMASPDSRRHARSRHLVSILTSRLSMRFSMVLRRMRRFLRRRGIICPLCSRLSSTVD
jgi:acetyl esterase/lipase